MHFVVAYDIESDRRRTKVMNTLKDFGIRIQYSVFECDLTSDRLDELRQRLKGLILARRDRVHLFGLCERCYFRAESLGTEPPGEDRL